MLFRNFSHDLIICQIDYGSIECAAKDPGFGPLRASVSENAIVKEHTKGAEALIPGKQASKALRLL